jgi:HSP20 family protein
MTSRYDPFEQMNRFLAQTRRSMMDDGWQPRAMGGRGRSGVGEFDANVGVEETNDGYVVVADLPGFEKSDLDVRFDDGVLTIHGETELGEESEGHSQWRSRRVAEQLSIPGDVVADEITASYHNGVLEITVPTAEDDDADDHRIDIE